MVELIPRTRWCRDTHRLHSCCLLGPNQDVCHNGGALKHATEVLMGFALSTCCANRGDEAGTSWRWSVAKYGSYGVWPLRTVAGVRSDRRAGVAIHVGGEMQFRLEDRARVTGASPPGSHLPGSPGGSVRWLSRPHRLSRAAFSGITSQTRHSVSVGTAVGP